MAWWSDPWLLWGLTFVDCSPVKVLSVVGNRPQFIKSGPCRRRFAARDRRGRAPHGPALGPRALRGLLRGVGLPAPAYRLDLHTATPTAMRPPGSPTRYGASGPTGCSSTATPTRRSPARGGRDAATPGRARRGGPAQRRPLDAGGAQPDRGRPDLATAAAARRALEGDARAGRGSGRDRGRRRRDGRRVLRFAPIARERSQILRGSASSRAATSSRPSTARRTSA